MNISDVWELFKELFKFCRSDRVSSLSAALTFYTIFSLAPILLICIILISFFLGEVAVQGHIVEHFSHLAGPKAALQIQTMIENTQQTDASKMPQIIGIFFLIYAATQVFAELQNGLNIIWGVKPKPGRWWFITIKERFLSFSMVIGIALLLFVSMVLGRVKLHIRGKCELDHQK